MLLEPSSVEPLTALFSELEAENARRMPDRDLTHRRMIDLRYAGQGSSLTLPWQDDVPALTRAFESAHEQTYGHRLDLPVEVITLRASATADMPAVSLPTLPPASTHARIDGHTPVHGHGQVPYYAREQLRPGHTLAGPAIVGESTSTVWLPPAWELSVATQGHLLLVHGKGA
jgi:N-methylhydantoinase A